MITSAIYSLALLAIIVGLLFTAHNDYRRGYSSLWIGTDMILALWILLVLVRHLTS